MRCRVPFLIVALTATHCLAGEAPRVSIPARDCTLAELFATLAEQVQVPFLLDAAVAERRVHAHVEAMPLDALLDQLRERMRLSIEPLGDEPGYSVKPAAGGDGPIYAVIPVHYARASEIAAFLGRRATEDQPRPGGPTIEVWPFDEATDERVQSSLGRLLDQMSLRPSYAFRLSLVRLPDEPLPATVEFVGDRWWSGTPGAPSLPAGLAILDAVRGTELLAAMPRRIPIETDSRAVGPLTHETAALLTGEQTDRLRIAPLEQAPVGTIAGFRLSWSLETAGAVERELHAFLFVPMGSVGILTLPDDPAFAGRPLLRALQAERGLGRAALVIVPVFDLGEGE